MQDDTAIGLNNVILDLYKLPGRGTHGVRRVDRIDQNLLHPTSSWYQPFKLFPFIVTTLLPLHAAPLRLVDWSPLTPPERGRQNAIQADQRHPFQPDRLAIINNNSAQRRRQAERGNQERW